MRKLALVCVFLGVPALLAGAQVYSDSFNYPDGTNVPGWNESVGDWSIQNRQLVSEHRFLWQYIVLDRFQELNACLQMTVIAVPSTQFYQDGGATLRYSTSSNVMCKIQDNDRNGDFDRCYVYDRPGAAANAAISPVTKRGTVRFFAIDLDLVCQIDADLDGKWDLTVSKQTAQTPTAGKIGIHGLGGVMVDDFKFFNAVARIDPASQTPSIGSFVTFQLKGPPNQIYQCACSLGNAGFPLDPVRRIPLDVDNLMILSILNPALFQRFAGRLDSNGDGKADVAIPKIVALRGQTFYFGMVVLDPNAPNMIGNISNDVRVDIQ